MAEKTLDDGLYCAEMVLSDIANKYAIDSPIIPKIATGLCSGMARTGGPCGAMTGGILALNLLLGRDDPTQTVERNYAAVQELVEQFEKVHGSTQCKDLLGCDLGTTAGQKKYLAEQLGQRCYKFSNSTIQLVETILQTA